jgi:uncharacterized protein (DUF1697 family)
MPSYIAFLRGINLGNRRIKMDRLAALFEEMGFGDVSTFIASGNVVFESEGVQAAALEDRIERRLQESLGYPVDTFVRTRAEVAAVAGFTPFSPADMVDPRNTTHVGFLKDRLPAEMASGLLACATPVDSFHVDGREFYWLCRVRTIDSQVWTLPEMKALKLPTATMRNITMLRKLAVRYPAAAGS